MVMADYFIHDKLQELWQQINQLHLTYLDTEESPVKLEHRYKLEACVREYLCLAPHNRKFFCRETSDVLHRSASSKDDFSGYRAALAWNAVGMYAGNLLSQPWRKEYRQIKTYSGFYKHEIKANLVGAEAMFEVMGYKHAGDGILVLEGPICPDRVAHVSQDSIVAFVECQILKTIWEEVSANFKISWLDVLEFRESYLCSVEQSIRMLNHRYHERRYQEQQQRTYASVHEHYSVPRYTQSQTQPMPPQNNQQVSPMGGVPPFPGHMHYVPVTTQCPGQCVYANPYLGYQTYAPVQIPRYSVPYPVKVPCQNGFCYPNGCVPPPYIANHPVPTAQLIELDAHNTGYDATDAPHRTQRTDVDAHKQLAKSTNLDSLTLSKSKEDGAGSFESWDYVYRNLESQGYTKDLGERGDLLVNERRSSRPKKPESDFNNVNVGKDNAEVHHNLTISEGLKRFDQERPKLKDEPRTVTHSSSYDNVTSHESTPAPAPKPVTVPAKSISNGTLKTKTLPKDRPSVTSPEKHSATLDPRKLRKQDVDKIKGRPKEKQRPVTESSSSAVSGWSCNACTYLNKGTVDICAMCGKSRKAVDVTMAVGGSQCPVCTLVNPKDVTVCEACGSSLQNSATYI